MVGCPFSRRAKRRALAIAVWLLLPGGVGDPAGAMASGNCRIFETSLRAEICSDPQLASEATRLKNVYESLKKSPAQTVAFLANADESAFIISLNDCRNAPSIETPPLSTPDCAAKRLEEKLATMSQRSDSAKLLENYGMKSFSAWPCFPLMDHNLSALWLIGSAIYGFLRRSATYFRARSAMGAERLTSLQS
jgi:uncharacterized protein